jgi:hypothetical protein
MILFVFVGKPPGVLWRPHLVGKLKLVYVLLQQETAANTITRQQYYYRIKKYLYQRSCRNTRMTLENHEWSTNTIPSAKYEQKLSAHPSTMVTTAQLQLSKSRYTGHYVTYLEET